MAASGAVFQQPDKWRSGLRHGDRALEYMLERDGMIPGGIPAQAVQIY
jgi:hypothetical protein